ncbi:uncharacterized protein [Procambarus clarkii]|uniref:uncharacterized protein n=1 Tax=Procambarus clarkii TaxID=6728 RepID=UPI001E673057|nr:uncharacterized protein LOC123773927 [Procambarus clarkii]
MNGLNQLVLVILVVAAACEAGMFGAGNVMSRRYPNGPTEFHDMKVPIYGPSTTQLGARPVVAASPAGGSSVGVRTVAWPVARPGPFRWWERQRPNAIFRNSYYGNY